MPSSSIDITGSLSFCSGIDIETLLAPSSHALATNSVKAISGVEVIER